MRLNTSATCLIGFLSVVGGCATSETAPELSPVERESLAFSSYLSARLAEGEQNPTAAARYYGDSLAYAPERSFLRAQALVAALSAGDAAGAVEAARLAAQDDEPLAKLVLAAEALSKGREAAARDLLTGVSGGPVERMSASLIQAWSQAANGRSDLAAAALADLDFRIEAAGLAGLVQDQQALVQVHARDFAGAVATFAASEPPIRLGGVDLRRAQALYQVGRRDEARAVLARRLLDGYDPRAAEAMAALDSKRVRWPNLTPREAAALGIVSFAAALAGTQPADRYMPYITLALIVAPEADSLRLLQAEAQRALGRPEAALASLGGVGPNSPYALQAAVQRAWLSQEAGDVEAAIQQAQQAAQSEQNFAIIALADLYRLNERWAEAEAQYDRLFTRAEQPDWRLHYLRGAVRERLGRWPEAEADLRQALVLEPDHPEVLNYLGYGWVERGERLQEALEMLQRAARLEPRAGHIVDSLGWAYFQLGDQDAAQNALERAVELSPDDPNINDHLGDLYARLGRTREARFQWERALSFAEEPALRASLQTKLESSAPSPGLQGSAP